MSALRSAHVTATGTVIAAADFSTEVRVTSLHWRDAGSASGSIVLRDGGASGPVMLTIGTDANSGEHIWSFDPDFIRFTTDVYATLTNVDSLTLLFF